MADVLVSGIKISEMDLVNDITGSEKLPTDQAGDKAVNIDQILTYVNNKVKPTWGNIQGDIDKQTDLINNVANRDEAIRFTLQTEIDSLQDQVNAIGVGSYGFKTYAEMDAAKTTLPANSLLRVTNDPNTANNGDWQWDGTTLTKSLYDPLTQAKDYSSFRESTGTYKNVFNIDEIKGLDLSRITNQVGRTAVTKTGVKTLKLSSPANTTTEIRWRFSAQHFKESGVISASINLKSLTASAGAPALSARMFIWQTNAAGASIKIDSVLIAGPEGITVERPVVIEGISLDQNAVYVEFGFSIASGAARDLLLEDLCLSQAPKGVFIRPVEKPVNLFPDKSFSGQYSSTFQGLAKNENGEQIMTFEVTSLLRQALYQIPAIGKFQAGSIVRFGADVYSNSVGATHMSMIFYDANNAEITRSTQASRIANVYDTLSSEFVIPANTVRVDIRLMKDANANTAKFKNVFLYSSNQDKVDFNPQFPLTILCVDGVNGLDTNNGTTTAPLKTLARAMQMGGYNTKIIVSEGDYAEFPLVSSKIANLEVVAARNSRVRIIGGVKPTGFTKTAGYTKVWQVPLATNPVTDATDRSGYWLYQHGVSDPNTVITRRWKNQLGRTSRLPDTTQIWRVSSIAEIDSATTPAWFWDAGVLYLSVVGGGDPNTADIRIPETINSPFYTLNTTKNQTIKLVGIESYYWLSGFRVWDFASVELINCKAIGNRVNGFETSDNVFVRQVSCEAYGNWVDGNGGHVYRENVYKKSCRYEGVDNYFHDNGDDGLSYHEMWSGYTSGMLCEYNGDRGVADAVGAHMVHIYPILYKNGQGNGKWSIDDGAGIACVGTAIDGGISTDTIVFGGISEGNLVNFNVGGSSENVMNLYDCKSFYPVQIHYGANNGTMNLYNCDYFGAGTIKSTVSGTINVINSTKVPE